MPEDRPTLEAQMIAAAANVKAVGKIAAQGLNYKFRQITDIVDSSRAALLEEGIGIRPEYIVLAESERSRPNGGVQTVIRLQGRFTFFNAYGDTMQVVTIGEGVDTSDKATNKAMTAALKYALIQTLQIPTGDDSDFENEEKAENPDRLLTHDERTQFQGWVLGLQPEVSKAIQDEIRSRYGASAKMTLANLQEAIVWARKMVDNANS